MAQQLMPKGMTEEMAQEDNPLKRIRLFDWIALGALVLTLAFFLFAEHWKKDLTVDVTRASKEYPYHMYASLKAGGRVVIGHKVSLSPQITGQLAEILVSRGDHVKKGQLLARLENTDAVVVQEQCEANLKLANANVEQAGIILGEAGAAFEKNRELYRTGSITLSDYRQSETLYRKARSSFNVAEATARAQTAALRHAELMLAHTRIQAPFDGIVLSLNAHVGDTVTSQLSDANEKQGILALADLSSLEVEVEVPEAEMGSIRIGQPCEIIPENLNVPMKGEVESVMPPVKRDASMALVRIRFIGGNPGVRPDMPAKVAFLARPASTAEERPVMAVDRSTLVATAGKGIGSVFLVVNDRIVKKDVRLGRQLRDKVEVIQGIAFGDVLVSHPPRGLDSGSRVVVSSRD